MSKRGFASMTREERTEIARKGGLSVSKNNEHMKAIAKKGGIASGIKRSKNAYSSNMKDHNFGKEE